MKKKKYSVQEIALLEQAAVQLRECHRILSAVDVPERVTVNGQRGTSTHLRLEWYVRFRNGKLEELPKAKSFFPRFQFVCYRDKNHLGPFLGSNTSLDGKSLMVWIGKTTFVVTKV